MPFNFKQEPSALRTYVLLVVLVVVSLVLVSVYDNEGDGGPLHGMQGALSTAVSPLKLASGALSAGEDSAQSAAQDASANADTLNALRDQNNQLREEVAELEEYRQEAQRLQGILDLKDYYSIEGTTCRVLARSTDAWSKTVTLDKGSNDGVVYGAPVVGTSGLVGQVISVDSFTCTVRLLQDPQFGVAAMIQSNRAQGVLMGNIDGLLYLEDVDSDAEVNAGDVVITSGLGGGFSRGIMIGTVVKVDGQQGDTNRSIVVEPSDVVSTLEEVTVVSSMGSDGLAADSSSSSSSSSTSSSSSSSSSSTKSNSSKSSSR